MRMMRGRTVAFTPRIERLRSLLGLGRSNSHEYLPVTPWSFQGCTQLRFSSSATPQPPYATPVPVESIPISDALKQCRLGISDEKVEKYLNIMSGVFEINNIGEWAALSATSKEQLIKHDLPEVVIQALDAWFLEQLGHWKMVPPKRDRNLQLEPLIDREATRVEIVNYVLKCCEGPAIDPVWTEGADNTWKCQLLCTSGVPGIGKSAVLSHVREWVQQHCDDRNVKAGSVPPMLSGFKVAVVSYNGGAPNFPVPDTGTEAVAFGHQLLRCNGFPDRWLSKITTLHKALDIMRAALRLEEGTLLIVAVDEILELDKVASSKVVDLTVSLLMRHQDTSLVNDKKAPVIFVFTSILEQYFSQMQTASGRPVHAIALPHLHLLEAHAHLFHKYDAYAALNNRHPGLEEAQKRSPALRQLILSCMGHPRALFNGIVENVNLAHLDTADMVVARKAIVRFCKFVLRSPEDDLRMWFGSDTLPDEFKDRLTLSGVLQHVDNQGFILPLMIQHWAMNPENVRNPLAIHLCKAYNADSVLVATHEKGMEEVLIHCEAVRRICRAGRPGGETIESFFGTQWIGDAWKARPISITIPPPGNTGIIQCVGDFSDVNAVLKLLQEGFTVMSKKRTEHGVEWAAPFFDPATRALLVECAQCKLVTDSVGWAEARGKLDNEFTRALRRKSVEWFPVMYTNHHTKTGTLAGETYADGVYFDELTLFDFTRPLGILRMHMEKLGPNLALRCPSLV